MTLLDAPAAMESRAVALPRPNRDLLEHLVALAAGLWWLGPMTSRSGGRGPGATVVALMLVTLLTLLSAPWKRTGRLTQALAILVPIGALAMCLGSPTGWYGADELASYTLAALTVPALAAYARTPQRRLAAVSLVIAATGVQFWEGFFPWWGGGTPADPMVGTFYSWNPFAGFLLPGALLGLALAVWGPGRWRALGWVVAPLASAGIVFSSSRTTTGLLGLGCLVMLLFSVLLPSRRGTLVRCIGVLLLSGFMTFALSGPPFFAHRAALDAAAQAKAASHQSVTTNGAYRVEFWHRAVDVLEHRPLLGSGAHGLVGASAPYVPASYASSNQAHEGYLQAFADGGVVLGVPFLLACLALIGHALRLLLSARRPVEERWLRLAVPVALGGVAAHSLVDLDWTFPSDLVLAAVLGGLALALLPRTARALPWPVFVAPVVALSVLAGVAGTRWDAAGTGVYAASGTPAEQAHALRQRGSKAFEDYRWGAQLLRLGTGQGLSIASVGVSDADLRWALADTRRESAVDGATALSRARALVLLHQPSQAYASVESLLRTLGTSRAAYATDSATAALLATGHRAEARRRLVGYLIADPKGPDAGGHLDVLLQMVAGPADLVDRCAYALVPTSARSTQTPDPGTPPAGVACGAVLQGAVS